jgi:hypothetical protein
LNSFEKSPAVAVSASTPTKITRQTSKFFSLICRRETRGHDGSMARDFRTSTVARIGRSYPRFPAEADDADHSRAGAVKVAAGVIALLSALGLLGWFLAR